MTLLELLDQIDETAPRNCQTCVHAYTHDRERCDTCLGHETTTTDERGKTLYTFEYRHWEPGNPLRALHAAQLEGRVNIVIGGSGEADFCATNDPASVTKHLHYVASECGYTVGRLTNDKTHQTLYIATQEGQFRIEWEDRQLQRISVLKNDDSVSHVGWDRNDPGAQW